MNTAYVIAGHSVINGVGTGARKYLDEAVEAEDVAKSVAHNLQNAGYKVYKDPPTWGLRTVLANLRKLIKPKDILVDIHFNAAISEKATGIEVFIPKNYTNDELSFAAEVANGLYDITGLPLRRGKLAFPGVKLENESQHNSLALLGGLGIGINILVELGFVTNQKDSSIFREKKPQIINFLTETIKKHL